MPNWKKVITSGSDASLNSLYSAGPITGSDLQINNWGSVSASLASLDTSKVNLGGNFATNEFIVASSPTSVTSSDALAVNSDGNLGIGTSDPEVRLHMLGEAPQTTQILMEQFNDTADAPDIRTRRYRGTSGSRADVQAGDYLFRLNVHGQDSGVSELYASMQFDVDSNDQDALEWRLQTRDTSGTVADRISIDSTGDFNVVGKVLSTDNIITSATLSGSAVHVESSGQKTVLETQRIAVTGTTTTIADIAVATHLGAIIDYTVYHDNANEGIRTGQIMAACEGGGAIEIADSSTADIGDTSQVTFTATNNGTSARITLNTPDADWNIRTFIRLL